MGMAPDIMTKWHLWHPTQSR